MRALLPCNSNPAYHKKNAVKSNVMSVRDLIFEMVN